MENQHITGKMNHNMAGTDSLDNMVRNLTILGFDKASTIILSEYKTQNTLEYGSRFNEVINDLLNMKSGMAGLGDLADLTRKIYALSSDVGNDTFIGNISYGNESMQYFTFFPKVAEFLKAEINNLKKENGAYTNFQDSLRKIRAIGNKGSISFIGCSELANFILSDYHRVVQEVIKFDTSPDAVDLEKIYSEEIPQLQEIASKNRYKVSGDVIYNGKRGDVSGFLYSFGEYLRKKIKYLDMDVGERDKIDIVEEGILEIKIGEEKTSEIQFDSKQIEDKLLPEESSFEKKRKQLQKEKNRKVDLRSERWMEES